MSAAGAAGALLASPLSGLTPVLGAPGPRGVTVYDDFSGGLAGYNAKWFQYTAGPLGDPVGSAVQTPVIDFTGDKLHVADNPFTMTYDNVDDHIKYLAVSTTAFSVPEKGSIAFSADIGAQTPGAQIGRVLPTTGHTLFEGQQATVTLHMFDFGTGAIFDWLISEHRALALYERLFVPGVGIDKGYTQILGEPNVVNGGRLAPPTPGTSSRDFAISPGMHNYAMRYRRNLKSAGPDSVEWLIDGDVVARVRRTGIPLDVQFPNQYRRAGAPIRYPSLGPGAEMKPLFSTFNIGHGLFSLVDEFPFNQPIPGAPPPVNIPPNQRLWGQGAIGTWDNMTVTLGDDDQD